MSAARHAYEPSGVAVVQEAPRSNAILLLILVLGLAAATIWFVALPTLDKALATPAPKSSCAVVVVESGVSRCVKRSVPLTAKTSKQSNDSKR